MKKYIVAVVSLILFVSCDETKKEAQQVEIKEVTEDTLISEPAKKKPLSPHTSTMAMVGDAHIHIDYSSPGVRNRMIFGGLLPYDAVWQAGAHKATWLETNKDLFIAGKKLDAGKYGFFVIPNQDEWTVIFNTNWDQHGKDDYNENNDVLRFKVKPKISDEIIEHLTYSIDKQNETTGSIQLAWEKVTISFQFKIM